MILAIMIAVHVSAATTPNPCEDQLATLCRISPYFCPGAYPEGLVPGTENVPCWPRRDPVVLGATRAIDTRGTGRIPPRSEGSAGVAAGASSEPATWQTLVRFRKWLAESLGAGPPAVER
jgi:hypothetical protein